MLIDRTGNLLAGCPPGKGDVRGDGGVSIIHSRGSKESGLYKGTSEGRTDVGRQNQRYH